MHVCRADLEAESTNNFSKTEFDSDILTDEKGTPLEYTSRYSHKVTDSLLTIISGLDENKKYVFKYDKAGFLIQISYSHRYAPAGNFLYQNYGVFQNGILQEEEVKDYKYELEHVIKVTSQKTTTVKGDNRDPLILLSESDESYIYGSDGKALSSVIIESDGNNYTKKFENGVIRLQTGTDRNGVVFQVNTYDNRGFLMSQKVGNTEYVSDFSEQGNLMSVKFISDNILVANQIFKYDDKKNPETLISNTFKGIPEVMNMFRRTNGVNNLIQENFENLMSDFHSENIVAYQYNAQNLPIESTGKSNTAGSGIITQNFKYRNCN